MSPDAVETPRWVPNELFALLFTVYSLVAAVVEACASFSLCAHSWQQTSTVLPPIVTLKEFESSLQSQAAQVFSAMASLLEHPKSGARSVGHAREEVRCQKL